MLLEEIDKELLLIDNDLAKAKADLMQALRSRATQMMEDLRYLEDGHAPFHSVSGKIWSSEGWEIQHLWTTYDTLRAYRRRWEAYRDRMIRLGATS